MASQTWESLIEGLGLQSATIGHRLLSGAPAPDWSKVPDEFGALVSPSSANSTKAMLLRLTAAEEKGYALVVVQGKVTVLHGFVEPPELNAQGGKFVAFLGDIRKVAGQTINPDLYELMGTNSRAATATHFASVPIYCESPTSSIQIRCEQTVVGFLCTILLPHQHASSAARSNHTTSKSIILQGPRNERRVRNGFLIARFGTSKADLYQNPYLSTTIYRRNRR